MANAAVVTRDGHVVGVQSWTEGFKTLKCPRKALTEERVLAMALWLEKRGCGEAAEELLDRFCAGFRITLA